MLKIAARGWVIYLSRCFQDILKMYQECLKTIGDMIFYVNVDLRSMPKQAVYGIGTMDVLDGAFVLNET
jgi:hypothetical protein